MKPLNIGEISIRRVIEQAGVAIPIDTALPPAESEVLDAHASWLEPAYADLEARVVYLDFHSYLLRTPRSTILIDTCIGNDKDRGGYPEFHKRKTDYLKRLTATGTALDDIDYVMCTHMHADHVGWNTRLEDGRWVPTFPKARYLFGRIENEHWRREYESAEEAGFSSFADSVLPVVESGQAVMVDDGHEVEDGVQVEHALGHTPGNVVIRLQSGQASGLLSGDVFHHPIQLVRPDWSSGFCVDPVASAKTRLKVVEGLADTDTIMLPAHFPAPTAGRVRSEGDGFRFVFVEQRLGACRS